MSLYVETTILQNQRAIMEALHLLMKKNIDGDRMAAVLDGRIKATHECIKDIR